MCDDFNSIILDSEYESPVDMIVRQISSEFDQKAENQLMLRVNQAIDFNVDKAELLRALQYDREQYKKGYEDAKEQIIKALEKYKNANPTDGKDDYYRGVSVGYDCAIKIVKAGGRSET